MSGTWVKLPDKHEQAAFELLCIDDDVTPEEYLFEVLAVFEANDLLEKYPWGQHLANFIGGQG